MRKGGGKSKGSSFERDICRRLSLWLTKGNREDVLWRSAMSGGRSTVAFKKGKHFAAQAGDISSIDPLGNALTDKFLIECKSYSDLNFIGLLTNKGNLVKFWSKLKEDSAKYKKMPLLIAKQNQQPVLACLSKEGVECLGVKLESIIVAPRLGLYIVLFERFLDWAVAPNVAFIERPSPDRPSEG